MSDKQNSRPVVHHGFLRSFGRVKSRKLGEKQQELLANILPKITIPVSPVESEEEYPVLSPVELYPEEKESVTLEIGFGGGEHLAALAARHPEGAYLGCEPFTNGVASLLQYVDEQALDNVRVLHGDVRVLLAQLAGGCLDRVYILFPDPWPKARHHKKRIINHALLDMLYRVMKDGAELVIATDHVDYSQWIDGHLSERKDFKEVKWDRQQPPEGWVETRYQQKARKQGREAVFFMMKKA